MNSARIHSIETLGAVDGPGLRCVVFMQGCPLRCIYCHNPDSREFDGGSEMTFEEIMRAIIRMKPYFGNEGGVTFSGGEPLAQPEALASLLRLCRSNNIHTAIDTSGCRADAAALAAAALADMLILDIKHPDPVKCQKLTLCDLAAEIMHLDAAEKRGQSVWIRHVVMPGWTEENDIIALGDLLSPYKCVKRVDLLPFHRLGSEKYEKLGIPYPPGDTQDADSEVVSIWEKMLVSRFAAKPD